MPKYRGTRAYNIREYEWLDFEAPDDAAARQMLLSGQLEDENWEDSDNSRDIATTRDEVFMLDRLDEHNIPKVVEDEIPIPSERPYSVEAREFVDKVAALAQEGAYVNATDTLDALIHEALALIGKPHLPLGDGHE